MNTTIKLSLLTTLLLNTNLIAEEKLEDIVITSATKTNQNTNDVTSNINVITAQEIEERHYTTVAEALNSLPGVSYTSNGGLGKTTALRLRGFDSDRTIILVDGIRYNDMTGLNGAPLEHMMITDIKQIEVVKGAQSGIWGADATAGVINIITKSAQNGLHIHASEEFGKFSTTKTNLGASYKNHLFYLKADMTKVDSKGFTSKAPKGQEIDQFEDDGYRNQTSSIKAGININETNKLEISHTILKAHTDYDGFAGPDTPDYSSTDNSYSSINFNHIDSFNEVDIYAKKSTIKRDYPLGYTKSYEGEVKEYGLKSKIPYANDHFVVLGGDYKKFTHSNVPMPVTWPNPPIYKSQDYSNKALFLTNNNQFNTTIGQTTITESIRRDNYDEFKNKTTGKAGIKHTFTKLGGVYTSVNYGSAYNVPTPYERYGAYSNQTKELQPDSTKSFDISLGFKGLNATYFNNKIENMKTFNKSTFTYDNIEGTSRLKGYELSYDTTLGDMFATNLSYTRTEAKDADGFALERRAGKSMKFGLDFYGVEDLHLGINGEYVGDRIQYAYGTHTVNAQTGNYTVANFVANYDWDKHLSFYGKVDNITDKEYQTVEGYATSPRAAYAGMKLTY
jgi:vitamin B12 transporter